MPRDKHEKFQELAEKRVTRALKDLRLVGNLANKNNYEYTEEEASKVIKALEREVKTVKARFEDQDNESETTFRLK